MAGLHRLDLPAQHRGRHAGIPGRILHGPAHPRAGQVAAEHRHAGTHGFHHHRAVVRPGPGRVVPCQRCAHGGFGGIARQAGRAVAGLGHLHHQRRQLPAARQRGDGLALQPLVVGRVVLLAQEQDLGGQQRLPGGVAGRRGGRGGAGARSDQGQQGQGGGAPRGAPQAEGQMHGRHLTPSRRAARKASGLTCIKGCGHARSYTAGHA